MIIILLLIGTYYYQYQNSGQTAPQNKPSIAVLPLYDFANDAGLEYFVDGIHEALIGELGRINNLRVISRTSTLQFKNPDLNIKEIADRLVVNNIVEGSVYGAGDSIRIQIQLIAVQSAEQHLWAEAYYRDMSDVLNLLNDVTRIIANEIQVVLTPEEESRFNNVVSVNPETFKAYLRGMFYLNKSTPGGC